MSKIANCMEKRASRNSCRFYIVILSDDNGNRRYAKVVIS